ncbi:MAG: LCP family protein [Acutalibacteraceae bacterium]
MKKQNKPAKSILGTVTSNSQYNEQYENMVKSGSKKKHKKLLKVLLIILCIILAIAIIAASVFAYLYYSGKGQFNNKDKKPSLPAEVTTQDEGNTVLHNGEKYVFDENITTILCIGVDKDDEAQVKTDTYGLGGQADALFLVCIDNAEKKYTVLSINRDSMVDVDQYDTAGNFAGVQKMQICLSYAYGNGKDTSCKNTMKSVSKLLYDMPINSYFSINKASIPLLNDIIDGVDVPVYDENGNATGETTHLEGQEAYDYIHYRDISKLDSNVIRMKRQKSYITAFASKAIDETKKDLSTPLDMFETVSLYSTTDLNASKITYLTTNAFSDRRDIKIEYKSVPGKVVQGKNGYAEYKVNNKKLLDLIFDIFYDKVETSETK